MTQGTFLLLILAIFSFVTQSLSATAKVLLTSQSTGQTVGVVTFDEAVGQNLVSIRGFVTNLTPGIHGFHVHELGDIESGCLGAGGHFNPLRQTHGGPNGRVRHVGDLGNVQADARGVANISILNRGVSLFGPLSIIGRSLVIHSGPDDLGRGRTAVSVSTGNSGAVVACGVIGVASEGFQICRPTQAVSALFGPVNQGQLAQAQPPVFGPLSQGRFGQAQQPFPSQQPFRPLAQANYYLTPGFPPQFRSGQGIIYSGNSRGFRRKSAATQSSANDTASGEM